MASDALIDDLPVPLLSFSVDDTTSKTIFISLDTLRWDYVFKESAVADRSFSSELNSFIDQSVRFTNIISPSSWTLPSHASLFTGRYPYQHRAVIRGKDGIDTAVAMYPEQLRGAGIETLGITDGGFVSRDHGFDRGFNRYEETSSSRNNLIKRNLKVARQWIKERSRSDSYFLFVHTYQVHDYWKMRSRCLESVNDRVSNLPERLTKDGELVETTNELDISKPDNMKLSRQFYQCEVDRTLKRLTRFFQWLRDTNRWDDHTIVLFSDHGEGFSNEPKIHGHGAGQLNESLVRVPVMVKFPGNRFGGNRITSHIPVHTLLPLIYSGRRMLMGKPDETVELSQGEFERVINDFSRRVTHGSGYRSRTVDGEKKLEPMLFVRTSDYKLIADLANEERQFYEINPRHLKERRLPSSAVPDEIRNLLVDSMRDYRRLTVPVYQEQFQRWITFRNNKKKEAPELDALKGLGYFE